MKKLLATVCILGTAMTLAACTSDSATTDSGASFANERTAGDVDTAPAQRTFRRSQRK